ncbi:MAG: hypothetical protein J1F35_06255 [Erysipelotrichales bacterium]|nr:hypothetical protein [Erysipelotrichales bacterium]
MIGSNNVQTLLGPTINAAANFVSGTTTSAFQVVSSLSANPINEISKINGEAMMIVEMAKNGVFSLTDNFSQTVGGSLGQIAGIGSNVLGAITQLKDVGMTCVQDVFNYGLGKIDVLRDKVTPDPDRVVYWTTYYTTYHHDYLLSQYMKKDNYSEDDIKSDEEKRISKKSLDDYLMVAENAVQEANQWIQKIKGKLEEKIKWLEGKVLIGPEKADEWINKELAYAFNFLDDVFDEKLGPKVENKKEEYSEWVGKQMGKSAGATWAWTEYMVIYKTKMAIQRKKDAAITEAKATTQDLTLRVIADLGLA